MLSLIIPTYNGIEYLGETVRSVLVQPLDGLELILVDDGSSDGTAERLEQYRKDLHGKAKVILREHAGVSAARNAGIEAAAGDWIAFMDCDDCLMDGFLKGSRAVMEHEADLYIFSFQRVEMLPDAGGGGPREHIIPVTVPYRFYETASDFADHYIRERHLLIYSACNKFYRKSLLDEAGIRFREDLAFGEDRMFNYDYLRCCGSIVTSGLCMFRYMQRNADSASRRIFPDYRNTLMKLHEAKVDCFISLSRSATEQEKAEFIAYDYATETQRIKEMMDQER